MAEHACPGEFVDLEQHLAGSLCPARVLIVDASVDHQLDHLRDARAGRQHTDAAAVAQHGDPVGDVSAFLQAVGDEHQTDALLTQVSDDLQQLVGLGAGQCRGRLVQNEHLGVQVDGTGDLHQLRCPMPSSRTGVAGLTCRPTRSSRPTDSRRILAQSMIRSGVHPYRACVRRVHPARIFTSVDLPALFSRSARAPRRLGLRSPLHPARACR
ncbi:MAG TPA: hypothetical protein VNA67_00980 [Pseudonocardiaceae bacterium]|nr:hypothetical protein [Pseudonocardiaceae bacterium]